MSVPDAQQPTEADRATGNPMWYRGLARGAPQHDGEVA